MRLSKITDRLRYRIKPPYPKATSYVNVFMQYFCMAIYEQSTFVTSLLESFGLNTLQAHIEQLAIRVSLISLSFYLIKYRSQANVAHSNLGPTIN